MEARGHLKVWAIIFLVVSIIVGAALVLQANQPTGVQNSVDSTENLFMYEKSIDVLLMLLIGFGFLMVFVRKYGYTSMTATYLMVALSLPLYMVVRPYLWGSASALTATNISMLIFAEFAAASLLIAIGGPLGRVSTSQYLLIGLLFTPLYALNEWLLFSGTLIPAGSILDTAGSISIHAFGAYFAVGLIVMLTAKKDRTVSAETSKRSNQFAMLGSAALWIFWPSFCSALVAVDMIPLVAINTVMALCGATIATYVFSIIIRGKIEISDIANASLAGGVAIGASCANVTPGWAILVGTVAGALSVVGYTIIQPRLQKLTGGVDTCGVHNLHGMPGVFGGLVAMVFVAAPLWQLAGITITVLLAVGTGLIVGLLVSKAGNKSVPYDDREEFILAEEAKPAPFRLETASSKAES